MAGTGIARDMVWARYTANSGAFFSVLVDKNWASNASSGLAARNAADPVFIKSKRNQPRKVLLQDAVSSRKTSRILGTVGAAAGVIGATVTMPVPGATGVITYTSQGVRGEKLAKQSAIISKPEPIAV